VTARACFGAAAIAFVAGVFPAIATAQTAAAPRPKVFAAASDAIGLDYVPDQQGGLTPIKDTFHMQFVNGYSSMSSTSGPMASAAVADPGNGATQGPAAACPIIGESFGDAATPFMPFITACTSAKWPFTVRADGLNPDRRTEGSTDFGGSNGQVSGQGGSAHAVVNPDGTSLTDATMAGLRLSPLPGGGATGVPLPGGIPALPGQTAAPLDTSVFTEGSIQASTRNYFEGSTAVTHSESVVSGVRMLGGLASIDSITSVAEVRYAPGAAPVGTSSTTVQGFTVLGQPATITDQGVQGQGSPDAVNDALNQALNAQGLFIRLVPAVQEQDASGFMTARAQGVVIDYSKDVQTGVSVPPPPSTPLTPTSPSVNGVYFVRYNFASVHAKALVRDLPAVTPAKISVPTVSGGGSGSTTASGFTGGSTAAPTPAPALGSNPGEDFLTKPTLFGLNFDLRWLYLAFTLAGFGMCIAPRLVLPARLPGQQA
jgi:hypothetical protein